MARTKQPTAHKSTGSKTLIQKVAAKRRAAKTTKTIPLKPAAKKVPQKKVPQQREEKEEGEEKKQHIIRKGGGRRGVIRETSLSTDEIVSQAGFRRMVKAVCHHLGTNTVVVPPLFDASHPFRGYHEGLSRGSTCENRPGVEPRSGNYVAEPNDKLLRIQFGKESLHILQQLTENELSKIIEHTVNARVEEMSPEEYKRARGTNLRIRPHQLEGAFARYYKDKDPLTVTYFRYYANLLGKRCSIRPPRVE